MIWKNLSDNWEVFLFMIGNFKVLRFSSILERNVYINLQEINIYNRCEISLIDVM